MIQLNNLTEVNTAMTELSDRQTCNIQGGAVSPKDASAYAAQAAKSGNRFTDGEFNRYLSIRSVQG